MSYEYIYIYIYVVVPPMYGINIIMCLFPFMYVIDESFISPTRLICLYSTIYRVTVSLPWPCRGFLPPPHLCCVACLPHLLFYRFFALDAPRMLLSMMYCLWLVFLVCCFTVASPWRAPRIVYGSLFSLIVSLFLCPGKC